MMPPQRGQMCRLIGDTAHWGQAVILHIVDEHVRVLTGAYKLVGEATLDPAQSYQLVRRVKSLDSGVHVSTMTRHITKVDLESHNKNHKFTVDRLTL